MKAGGRLKGWIENRSGRWLLVLSWRSPEQQSRCRWAASPAIERQGCKCDPEDRGPIIRSHAAGFIFSSTCRNIDAAAVVEIKDDGAEEEVQWVAAVMLSCKN